MNKLYVSSAILLVVVAIAAPWLPPYIPAWMFSLVGLVQLYMLWEIQKSIVDGDRKQGEKLVEAGNAITDTLRVVFDNLKKFTVSQNKTQAKITDHESRIRRIEQGLQRTNKANKLTKKVESVEDTPQPPKKIEEAEKNE